LCTACHQAQKYDAPSHHFHRAGGTGSSCVSCHMPTTTYMVVDRRRDHSIRVPRPDRTLTMGVPNACNGCHADRPAAWAADQVRGWYGRNAAGFQTFADTFHADDAGRVVDEALAKLVADLGLPAIVRASALARLGRTPGRTALMTAQAHLGDPDPNIRYAAASVFETQAPEDRAAVRPLLSDPRRAIRIEAAWLLAPAAPTLTGADAAAFERAAEDFVSSRELRADRPEDRMTLGMFLEQRGRGEAAIEAYRSAARLAPDFAPAHHTLGLALVRAGSKNDALGELKLAAELATDAAGTRFQHDYAVALHSFGRVEEAIAALESARARAPSDRDVLFALTTFHRDAGRLNDAVKYATQLQRFHPDDPDAAALLQSLRPSQAP
jgi:tetratricopeptide (TPR) repeat protein